MTDKPTRGATVPEPLIAAPSGTASPHTANQSLRVISRHTRPLAAWSVPLPDQSFTISDHGWNRSGEDYKGYYRVGSSMWPRYARRSPTDRTSGRYDFFFFQPPPAIWRLTTSICWEHIGEGWFHIHYTMPPPDLLSGVKDIEHTLHEALTPDTYRRSRDGSHPMRERGSLSKRAVRLQAPGIPTTREGEEGVLSRAARLPGYDLPRLNNLEVLVVGCGGLGGEVAQGFARSGVGHLICCDHDVVTLSNLNRQRFFSADLYQNKALRLAHNLVSEASAPMHVTGIAADFRTASGMKYFRDVELVVCAVDNDQSRVEVARWCLTQHVPAIFCAVNDTSDYGYAFVQTGRPNEPCFGCLFPDAILSPQQAQCIGATIDILKIIAGLVLYAAVASVMPNRSQHWCYKEVSLAGTGPDGVRTIPKRPDCPLCTNLTDARILID